MPGPSDGHAPSRREGRGGAREAGAFKKRRGRPATVRREGPAGVSGSPTALGGVCPALAPLAGPRLPRPPLGLRVRPCGSRSLREPPGPCARELCRRPTGPPRDRDMVPSQEEPAAAARGTGEEQPPGPEPSDDASLPGPGPSDVPDVSAEKVEVELSRSTGDEPTEPPEPPEGGWGWLVMLAAMWCNGSVFGIQNAYGVLFLSMLDTFGAKDDDNMAFKTGGALRRARAARWVGTHTSGAWCVFLCPEGVSCGSSPVVLAALSLGL